MFILVFTVFAVFGGFSTFSQAESGCNGESIVLPAYPFSPNYTKKVYFIPKYDGHSKLVMNKGKPEDPRIKLSNQTFYLTNLTTGDKGYFATSDNMLYQVFSLDVLDCAQKISKFYMDTLEYSIPPGAQFLEFTPRIGSGDEPIILWNRTNLQINDERRGKIYGNIWSVSNLTQADDGFYSFRQKDNTLKFRLHLMVTERSDHYGPKVREFLYIKYPPSGGPWTVIFKPEETSVPENVLKDGQVVSDYNRFSGRINTQHYGFDIDGVEMKDSGTFEFRDPQGNLALTVQVYVSLEPNHALITYVAVGVGVIFLWICCCCCCKKCCCKKDSSAPQTEAAPTVTYHDKTPGTAASPAVYYHGVNPPLGPRYSAPANTSVFPPQPMYQPVNIYPPQPGSSVNRPQPGSSVNPPQPGSSVNPPQPGINMNPLQPEVVPPTDQGSAAAPSFSLAFLSSDPETRFELKGLSGPSAFPLSSETPSNDVYNSNKLNFL